MAGKSLGSHQGGGRERCGDALWPKNRFPRKRPGTERSDLRVGQGQLEARLLAGVPWWGGELPQVSGCCVRGEGSPGKGSGEEAAGL